MDSKKKKNVWITVWLKFVAGMLEVAKCVGVVASESLEKI